MKKGIKIILLISIIGVAASSYLPDFLVNKMNKQVGKLYGKGTKTTELVLADSLDLNHQLFSLSKGDSLLGYSIITRALGCQLNGCENPSKDTSAFEEFYFMTAFDAKKQIKKVRVLSYPSDHGYQVANKAWLRQFENNTNFELGTNIDGISGATISAKSMVTNINLQTDIIHTITPK